MTLNRLYVDALKAKALTGVKDEGRRVAVEELAKIATNYVEVIELGEIIGKIQRVLQEDEDDSTLV